MRISIDESQKRNKERRRIRPEKPIDSPERHNDTPEKEINRAEKWPKGARRENSACGRDAMHCVCMFRRKKFFLKRGEGGRKGLKKERREEKRKGLYL